MSLSHLLRRASLAGAALALLPASFAAAAGSTPDVTTVDAQCNFPEVGIQPVHATLSVTAGYVLIGPSGGVAGPPSGVQGTVQVDLPEAFRGALRTAAGGDSYSMAVDVQYTSDRPRDVEGALSPGTLDASNPFSGTAAVKFDEGGNALVDGQLDGLTLKAFTTDGAASTLPAVTTDVDGHPFDGGPGAIPCKTTAIDGQLWVTKTLYFAPPSKASAALEAADVTSTSATVSWALNGSQWTLPADHLVVVAHDVDANTYQSVLVPLTATSATFDHLVAGHSYDVLLAVYVSETATRAEQSSVISANDLRFTTPPSVTPAPTPTPYPQSWTLAGSLALSHGVGSLKASLSGLDLGAPSSSGGAMTFSTTSAKLSTLLGVPVQATMLPVPVGSASSTRTGDVVALSQPLKLRLVQARILGIPLVTGSSCLTPASTASLSGSVTRAGGTLTGSAALGRLSGCGVLTSLVGPLLGGRANVVLALTPAPVAAPVVQ